MAQSMSCLLGVQDKVHIGSYIARTFDGVAQHSHVRKDNYFYYNCLMGRFTRDNCPTYLQPDNFKARPAWLPCLHLLLLLTLLLVQVCRFCVTWCQRVCS